MRAILPQSARLDSLTTCGGRRVLIRHHAFHNPCDFQMRRIDTLRFFYACGFS